MAPVWEHDGPDSTQTCGQFPADDVANWEGPGPATDPVPLEPPAAP